jgi:polyhydroxyalkanoate synthesis regulator phasin
MPTKKRKETQEEQSERFKEAVRDLVAAGKLSPTEADDKFEALMGRLVKVAGPS